ncbi:hypothetical protein A8C75_12725 [Marinobacterium aestuarii]|uniref:Cyclic nucleotide-binding protein n=1 Tax=Marinobacterium aestuarii TaxID=1821621 RepID=A0A1A9F0E6_9GAMM|nr:hypothetical protein A8C75_12725 [Marinobacterium aestuarii]
MAVSEYNDLPTSEQTRACVVCGQRFPRAELRPWISVRPQVSALIAVDLPAWSDGDDICVGDLAIYRRRHVEALLAAERGELSSLDHEVLQSLEAGALITLSPDAVDEGMTFGERMSDRVASFGGSWTFILSFLAVLIIWMALNVSALLFRSFDPYPFILLNLVLSCVAALQAPIIMMSQRRQESKDRLRAENDYRVNLKAELEIRLLHDKIDHQLSHQWQRLAELHEIQIELLEERGRR